MEKKKKKILVIRLGAIGDVVHTTIIPKSIKLKHPEYEIHYLSEKHIVPLLKNNPYIDNVIELDPSRKRDNRYLLEIGIRLFKEHYDLVFNLTNAIRNHLLSIMAFPKRIIQRVHTKGSWVEDFFYTAKKGVNDITIADELTLGINEEAEEKVSQLLKNYPRPYTMIVPGGGTNQNRQGRIWNIDKWKELSDSILSIYGGTIVVCGSKSERIVHEKLNGNNIFIVSGELALVETSALLSKANLVISGDTGPVHIASAHSVNTISILGSTSPDKIKPYGPKGYYVSAKDGCKFCWKKKCKYLKEGQIYTPCMEKVTPQMVLDIIRDYNLLLGDDAN